MPVEKMSGGQMSFGHKIPLVLVSGFLGSGKTTFLNNLFNLFPDKKFGIIVNDFGAIGVDAAVIKSPKGAIIKELNNGQIFCSCLAGSFIKSVSAYADLDIDYLLVETSGLAKPSPILEIIEALKKLNGNRFSYFGMVSLVDCGTYLDLSNVLKAVDEQIHYSDLVIMNKTDTVDTGTLKKVEMKILLVNPDADIIRTEYGRLQEEDFLKLNEKKNITAPDGRFAGWGGQGRPVPILLQSKSPVSLSALQAFVDDPGGDFYRMKGRLSTDSGMVYVDCTTGQKEMRKDESSAENGSEGLVIILPADENIVSEVKQRASVIFGPLE